MPLYRYNRSQFDTILQGYVDCYGPTVLVEEQYTDRVAQQLLRAIRLESVRLDLRAMIEGMRTRVWPVDVDEYDRVAEQFWSVCPDLRNHSIPFQVNPVALTWMRNAIAMAQTPPARNRPASPAAERASAPSRLPEAGDLTFGIEIECYIPEANARGISVGAYHAGIQVQGLPPGWNAQRDGSVGYRAGYLGFELVSPKLKGVDGINQVKQVADWLKEKGAKVYQNCGFHVHVGLGPWKTNGNLNKLVMLAKYWAPALYAITGTISREQGTYCKVPNDYTVQRILQANTPREKAARDGERYRLLNLQPINRAGGGTVEFRVFSGTVKKIKMLAYIQIALGLCEAACGNIAMTSLKMAPTGRLANELANGRVLSMVRELIRYVWRVPARPGNSKARGLLDAESLPDCVKELTRLAREYQAKKLDAIE